MTTEIALPGGGVTRTPEAVHYIGPITVHEHLARSRLIERWKDKDALKAVQASWGPELQEVENALWEVWASRFVDYANGDALDVLGRTVGQSRQGMLDPQFRTWIKARIRINRSQGHPDDVIEVMQLVEENFADMRYLEYYPASFDVHFDETPEIDPALLADLVRAARSGGVAGAVVYSDQPFAGSIVGAYVEDDLTDTQGGADEAETVGGVGANVYP